MTSKKSSAHLQELLVHRAELYQKIRQFFLERKVLEVETPIFSPYANTDPHISSLSANFGNEKLPDIRYAHTSPEFAMKRLLCEGSGSIFQICKVFRKDEVGHLHNPEFTMLEWYQLNMDYQALADEVLALLQFVGIQVEAEKRSFQSLFETYLEIDVNEVNAEQLRSFALQHGLNDCGLGNDKDGWINYLLTHLIEPELIKIPLLIVYDYPASQAALAEISHSTPKVALRFEVYLHGVELANGYQELRDASSYRLRFEKENRTRINRDMSKMPIDESLLNALHKQLPQCSGVALGIDRLLMRMHKYSCISDVLID